MEKLTYDKESLKIEIPSTPSEEPPEVKTQVFRKKQEETMSNRKAALVVVMLVVMYAIISAVPTFIMMYFFDVTFWLSQLIVFIGAVIVVWAFGLYKPASNEQKLKSKFLL